jgi:DNA-binding IclR family transcriptional regulator
VLRLLGSLSEDRPRVSIADLATDLGIPISTAYRYVAILREAGLLEEGMPGLYQVGPDAFRLARAAQAVNDLAAVARPILIGIRDQVDENVYVVRMIGDAAVCIDRVESSRAMRLSFHPGQALALGVGASGKALLSTRSPGERRALLELRAGDDPALGDRIPALLRELDRVHRQGWAESSAEIDEGVWAFSAVVAGYRQGPVALSVAGPAFRVPRGKQNLARRLILEGGKELTRCLEGRPTPAVRPVRD